MHYQRHTWPQLRRQPTFVDVPAGPNVKDVVRGGLIPTKAFLSVRTDHLHASARERILDARADFGR